ncbi:MAG: hypothetical protein AAGA73_12300 [Pseudomonadota bacterium]
MSVAAACCKIVKDGTIGPVIAMAMVGQEKLGVLHRFSLFNLKDFLIDKMLHDEFGIGARSAPYRKPLQRSSFH